MFNERPTLRMLKRNENKAYLIIGQVVRSALDTAYRWYNIQPVDGIQPLGAFFQPRLTGGTRSVSISQLNDIKREV